MATDFNSQYVNANLSKDATPYDSEIFAGWAARLQQALQSYTPGLSYGILTAMLCAQRRGDAAGPLFDDALKAEGEERVLGLFSVVRESVTVALGFVGLPNTMPANFGLIAQLKKRNIAEVPLKPRAGFQEADYGELGNATLKRVYRGVGNPEVAQMVAQYLPDLAYLGTTAIFGYAMGACNTLPLKECEIVVTSAIIALGALRQARSHGKASMQLGIAPALLETIDTIAHEVAQWNQNPLSEKLDVPQLVKELDAELAELESTG
ncbi:uncharacterized protein Z520_03992 [Fonsecaea multimorphosa CBS 102226]|uniref:Uncharacterized protein n=1 Tax=Fonsecaea multimorphosa CBS 102226 TaxID=1442371 RepID=A0A0D2ITL4_9EURO|nr:uncharacterized protein Z520_03992 [Fonsecaea multimorphosa CBS 102226]KIY00307.1 hypothetical protein Z520_03992 [Fonsecaea multimorphosa CBS 102226]OAL27140.1 hypothetical protein AYO22_03771 [Fonsecaea multimorphosa]